MSLGPASAHLVHELRLLYTTAEEPTYKQIVDHCAVNDVKVTDSSVEEWISGKNIPRSAKTFGCVIQYLQLRVRRKRPSASLQPLDVWETWRREAERERRSGQGRGAAVRPDSEAPGATFDQRTDPFALGVHPAIDGPATAADVELPVLPLYVPRAHDAELQVLVQRAAAGRSSVGAVIGSSSSGKSRACWEAIAPLRSQWRLWAPSGADEALRNVEHVAARTVIWLDETQHSLLRTPSAPDGEELARRLRELVHAGDQQPVLVLVTIWHEDWDELVVERDDDGHKQARLLLTGHGIAVEPAFTSAADQAALATAALTDPRLAQAAAEAKDHEVIQYLAGIPVLMERYRTADSGAKELIIAAMDARRLGHSRDLPLPFLRSAVPAYLAESRWQRVGRQRDWLRRALDYLEADCRGALGPLTPSPVDFTEAATSQEMYRLADYLEQHGRTSRKSTRVPPGCWEALLEHASRADLLVLAESAFQRCRYQFAVRLATTAAAAGDPKACGKVADWLDKLGRGDEARPWYNRAAALGDTAAICQVAVRLAVHDLWEQANAWFRLAVSIEAPIASEPTAKIMEEVGLAAISTPDARPTRGAGQGSITTLVDAVNELWEIGYEPERWLLWSEWIVASGRPDALVQAAWRLAMAGDVDGAIAWYRRALEAGDASALMQAVNDLASADRWEEALAWYEEAVAAGHAEELAASAWHLGDADSIDRALAFFTHAADRGDLSAYEFAAMSLENAGRLDEALTWWQKLATRGKAYALTYAATRLGAANRWDEAVVWYERAIVAGDDDALATAVRQMAEAGRHEQALEWYERATAGGVEVKYLHSTAQQVAEKGQLRDALQWFERAGAAGDADAFFEAGACLEKAGEAAESAKWYGRAAQAGNLRVLTKIAELLQRAGHLDEALRFYDAAVATGDAHAALLAAWALGNAGRTDDEFVWLERAATADERDVLRFVDGPSRADRARRLHLRRYGWALDGTVAPAWDAPLPQ